MTFNYTNILNTWEDVRGSRTEGQQQVPKYLNVDPRRPWRSEDEGSNLSALIYPHSCAHLKKSWLVPLVSSAAPRESPPGVMCHTQRVSFNGNNKTQAPVAKQKSPGFSDTKQALSHLTEVDTAS